ncbi:argonaute/piwi family protein [Rubritepida flocculans]|uniref:argonaute/piwi family protein n=1 Tax=Rubritepida flocculans TaxID=182403 RepID=UPI0009FDD020|nr:Piwi domain-containing protein [Rubritepida flocculans]
MAYAESVKMRPSSDPIQADTPMLREVLTLNLAPIGFSATTMRVGRLPYQDEEQYRALREAHPQHAFRFDSRIGAILNIGLAADVAVLGEASDVPVAEHLLLVGKAVQQALFGWLVGRRTILRRARPLQCWGSSRKAALLSAAIREIGLDPTPGIEVLVRHSFDTRVVQPAQDGAAPYLALLLDIGTSNDIAIPVAVLIRAGLDPCGLYVCRQEGDNEGLRPRLETIGCVAAVENGRLHLTDAELDGPVDAGEVVLEPRQETLEKVVRLFYPTAADRILGGLQRRRQPYVTAADKLQHIARVLEETSRVLPLTFTGGLKATIGTLLQLGDPAFPAEITVSRPGLLFGPQGRETGSQADAGIRRFGPYQYIQQERNEPVVAVICERTQRGRTEQRLQTLRSGFDEALWQRANKSRAQPPDNPFQGGLIGKFRLQRIRFQIEDVAAPQAEEYRRAIARLLQRLPQRPDLALVQTRASYWTLPAADNPYLAAKALFMAAGVPVQSIKAETIEASDRNLPYILNNLALASYAKLGGTPFVMSTRAPASHELVIGLGASEVGEGRLGPKARYVGLTTLFQADGRYLVWGQTREVAFEDYAVALLESLTSTIRFVREQNNWQVGDHVRLVFHVYKPLKHREIDAIKALVRDLVAGRHQVEFAFLDISRHHDFFLFDPRQTGIEYHMPGGRRGLKGVGVPRRGQCRQLSARAALLQLVGADEVKADAQGLPRPLLIELHPESDFTDLTYLARQVFHFSYLCWRSFFPAEEPVTILYSRLIARALGNLRLVPEWRCDVLTVGSLRHSLWFL